MTETNSTISDPPRSEENPNHSPSNDALSFSIWPPSKRTREAVVRRLVETLTKDTVLSKRYGSVPAEEAEQSAESIEKEAFESAQADSDSKSGSVEDGIEILQLYSKEVSKRMLEFAKGRAENVGPTPAVTENGSDE